MTGLAGERERRRLHETFATLCRIPSPSGDERACAHWITAELQGLGLTVEEDDAGSRTGGNAGNLLARIPGADPGSILFCAHMDTVPLTAPVDPVRVGGGWENANEGILGADNKSAVAAILELARILCESPEAPPIGVELLFTVAEESGLWGAAEFDAGRLRSRFGYVFDHASPWGEIIDAAPTHVLLNAEFRGQAAHAGLHPENGVNAIAAAARAVAAMPHGRLDVRTTTNVGTIRGGTASNVVADRCELEAEVRSLEQARADAVVTEIVDAFQDAADSAGCDLDLRVRTLFTGYRVGHGERSVKLAQRALRSVGHEPRLRASGGGADANIFRAAGLACTNLANGTERAHERTERVSDAALETGLDVLLALISEAVSSGGADGSSISGRGPIPGSTGDEDSAHC